MTEHHHESFPRRCWDHFLRMKSAIAILLLCGWYATNYEPKATEEATRLWILANVTWKLTLGVIMVHIGRHEMFPYMRFGLVVQDYRTAIENKNGLSACASAILAFGYCVLIGWLFATVIGVVGKW